MSGNPDNADNENSAHKGVLQIIRDAAARSATHIKLSLWRLTSLPPKLVGLKNLTQLDLNGEFLTSLPPGVAQLKNLTTLNVVINRLTSLPPEVVRQGTGAILQYLKAKAKKRRQHGILAVLVQNLFARR